MFLANNSLDRIYLRLVLHDIFDLSQMFLLAKIGKKHHSFNNLTEVEVYFLVLTPRIRHKKNWRHLPCATDLLIIGLAC